MFINSLSILEGLSEVSLQPGAGGRGEERRAVGTRCGILAVLSHWWPRPLP